MISSLLSPRILETTQKDTNILQPRKFDQRDQLVALAAEGGTAFLNHNAFVIFFVTIVIMDRNPTPPSLLAVDKNQVIALIWKHTDGIYSLVH